MKTCSCCRIPQSLDAFYPSAHYKDGHRSRCKACCSAIEKQYRANNPEKYRAQKSKSDKKWRTSPQGLEYKRKNAKHIAQHAAAYYQRTKKERDAYNTAWRKANPQKWTAIHARWVANKKGAAVNDFTNDQFLELLEVFDHRCPFCPSDCAECKRRTHAFTQDHLTPLSKYGPNTLWNIVPACRSCNAKKHTGPVLKPVQPLLITIAPAKPKRTHKKGSYNG